MKENVARQAGEALFWKTFQLAGVKSIFLLRILILARLLSPDDFGLLAIAVTAIGFVLGVTDFGMIPALVQREEVNDPYYDAAWTIGIIRASAISLIVFIAAPVIAEIFAEPRAVLILRALSIRPLLEATASVKLADLIRYLNFRSLAFVKLSEALLNTIVSIALAPTWGVWALVAGALAGSAAYLMMSYFLAPYRPRLSFDQAAAHALIRFGRWIFLTGLIAVLGSSVLKVIISRGLGAAELGLYFLAASIAFMPAELASEIVGSVAFPLSARLQTDIQEATRTFRGILIGLATLLVPVCALIIVLAPTLVQDVLGPRWDGTVPLVRLLAAVSFLGLFGEVIVPMLNGLGQPYKVTVLEAVQSLLLVTFVWALVGRYGVVGAALAWLPAVAASQGISAAFARQILFEPFRGLGKPMIAIAFASSMGAVAALGMDSKLEGVLGFVIANLIALPVIGILLWVSDRWLDLGLARGLAKAFPQVAGFVDFAPIENQSP